MRKKTLPVLIAVLALSAFAVAPALAQASVTLRRVPTGEALKVGTEVSLWSEDMVFQAGALKGTCSETEFAGTVSNQSPAAALLKEGGFGVWEDRCKTFGANGLMFAAWFEETPTVSFGESGGVGTMEVPNIKLAFATYYGNLQAGECEYTGTLAGTYTLNGEELMITMPPSILTRAPGGSGYCPSKWSLSGHLEVTASGNAVDASTS